MIIDLFLRNTLYKEIFVTGQVQICTRGTGLGDTVPGCMRPLQLPPPARDWSEVYSLSLAATAGVSDTRQLRYGLEVCEQARKNSCSI